MQNITSCAALAIAVGVAATTVAASTESTVFRDVDLFDGRAERLRTNVDVLVRDGLVAEIGEDLEIEGEVREIDGDGHVLMPGLIDMHWHAVLSTLPLPVLLTSDLGYLTLVGAKANEDVLMRGFTTVRDTGGNVQAIKRATDEGLIDGPRIFPSNAMIGQTGGHGDFRGPNDVPDAAGGTLDYFAKSGHSYIADGVPAVIQRAREVFRSGATQIKVMAGGGVSSTYDPIDVTQYTPAEMRAIVEVAESYNTYVTVHAFTDAAVQQAVEAGVRSIEHGHLLTESTLRMMAERDVWLSMQPILDDEDAIPFPEGSPSRAKFIEVTNGTDRVYRLAREIGVRMVFGTDTLFDPELATKQGKLLAKLERWFTPAEALAQATSAAGELLALSGPRNTYGEAPLGVVVEGAHADLLLVRGNPLEDLSLVADPDRSFVIIMKGGKVFKDTLDGASE